MQSSFHSNPSHPSQSGGDCSRQAALQVINTGCWHPLLWTGMTTLSTLSLMVLAAAIPQAVNAQTAIAQTVDYPSSELTGTIQSGALEGLDPSATPSGDPSIRPPANSSVDLVDLFVDLRVNLSENSFENFSADLSVDLITNRSTASDDGQQNSIAADVDQAEFKRSQESNPGRHEASNEAVNEAIGGSGEWSFDQSPDQSPDQSLASNPDPIDSEPFDLDRFNPDSLQVAKQPIAAGTENATSQETTPADLTSDPASDPAALSPPADEAIAQGGSALLGAPFIQLQGAVVVQGDEFSARARVSASYAVSPNVLVGGTLDLVTGEAFVDSPESGLNLNELYVAVSPSEIPTLRFAAGLLDYTSYFDRNSFAKDGVTQFFNPIFQTNPALAAAGLSSRPGVLVNWSVTDNLELRAAGFSSRRDLGDFAIDGFAAEAAVRIQNLILRGTYVTALDAGDDSGFREIFQFDRGDGDFGLRSGDREQAYGINAEYFVPSLRLGLFARYGWYDNLELGRGGETYSFGLNLLDLFMADDRLGLAYGRALSDEGLRQRSGDKLPDVLELFYDARLLPNLRAGITAQARNSFSETILGFRVRADFSLSDLGRRI